MSKVLRFGIVGCGVIAATHADAIRQIEGAELYAFCDVIGERASALAARFGIGESHIFSDVRDFLEHSSVDVVSICTPSGTHAEIAVAALSAGKAVVVEKPMDVTLEACSLLMSVQAETGLPVGVISQHRFDASSVYAHKLIESGGLGNLFLCEAQIKWFRTQEYYDSGDWRGTWQLDGGGALMNQGIHTVDLMLWLMGPVETVFAVGRTAVHQRIEVEDVICATLTFSNGAVGNLVASTAVHPGFPAQLSVHGSNGTVVISGDALTKVNLIDQPVETLELQELLAAGQAGHAIHVAQGGTKTAELNKTVLSTSAMSHWGDAHRAQYIDFMRAMTLNAVPRANCQTGRDAVEVITAAYESARTGRVVRLK